MLFETKAPSARPKSRVSRLLSEEMEEASRLTRPGVRERDLREGGNSFKTI